MLCPLTDNCLNDVNALNGRVTGYMTMVDEVVWAQTITSGINGIGIS